jgi:predicted transcriptional regulator of viral defense system
LQNTTYLVTLIMAKQKFTSSLDLSTWIDQLQSRGLYYFTREEALKTIKTSETALKQAATRLIKKNRIVRVYSGFYIIIPLEYASTGVLPAEWFIADLMDYVGQPYYVGLLSAAVLHGAAHQQPQQFHVVTDKPLRELRLKNLTIRFFTKVKYEQTPTTKIKVQTGFISVSSPEATAFDLLRYKRALGGIDRVLTVLQELGEKLDATRLQKAAQFDGNVAYAQRLGWLLERAGFSESVTKLAAWVSKKNPFAAKLESSFPIKGAQKDERWRLLINTTVEGDL